MTQSDSLFLSKEALYQDFRPEYPESVLPNIETEFNLTIRGNLAEFGSGTGKFTKHIQGPKRHIYAIEPDQEMSNKSSFCSERVTKILGSAENANLDDSSVDYIFCAQSFHHFNPEKARVEFERILKSNGSIVLIWYFSDMRQNISMEIRKNFYKFGRAQNQPKRMKITEKTMKEVFSGFSVKFAEVGNIEQILDLRSFLGSMCSSSYSPNPQNKLYKDYVEKFTHIFNKYKHLGVVTCKFNIISYHISRGDKR